MFTLLSVLCPSDPPITTLAFPAHPTPSLQLLDVTGAARAATLREQATLSSSGAVDCDSDEAMEEEPLPLPVDPSEQMQFLRISRQHAQPVHSHWAGLGLVADDPLAATGGTSACAGTEEDSTAPVRVRFEFIRSQPAP
eukprot:3718263-Prymnesium_polylepis.2